MKYRKAKIFRKTKETIISLLLNIDGRGKGSISFPVPFMSHMLDTIRIHSSFDISISAKGDSLIDDHHIVEDIGIVLGEGMRKALGNKRGIRRFGFSLVPMDDSLASVSVDLGGRPYLVYNVSLRRKSLKGFDISLVKDFFKAFSDSSGTNIHINLIYGNNPHHAIEAIFKAFARSLREACSIDKEIRGVRSTKGKL